MMSQLRRVMPFLSLLLLFALPAIAQQSDADRIIATARESSLVMEHLDYLVNRIGPRLTSSDNLTNACDWARERFASFGIDNARIEKWGEFPIGFNRGPWFGRMVEPEVRPLTIGTNSWTAGTPGVVKGKAILEPENDEQFEKAKDKLAGAW